MLIQLYNEDYIARRRDVEKGGNQEAMVHFILTFPMPQQNGAMAFNIVPLVNDNGTIRFWQDATIHPVPGKKVNA